VRLARGRFWAVLTRADGWYVQVGFGVEAGARAGWYALERQDGGVDHHFRTDLSDITEVAGALVGFLDDDPAWQNRFVWRPVDLG
jgi:hypothetical protein